MSFILFLLTFFDAASAKPFFFSDVTERQERLRNNFEALDAEQKAIYEKKWIFDFAGAHDELRSSTEVTVPADVKETLQRAVKDNPALTQQVQAWVSWSQREENKTASADLIWLSRLENFKDAERLVVRMYFAHDLNGDGFRDPIDLMQLRQAWTWVRAQSALRNLVPILNSQGNTDVAQAANALSEKLHAAVKQQSKGRPTQLPLSVVLPVVDALKSVSAPWEKNPEMRVATTEVRAFQAAVFWNIRFPELAKVWKIVLTSSPRVVDFHEELLNPNVPGALTKPWLALEDALRTAFNDESVLRAFLNQPGISRVRRSWLESDDPSVQAQQFTLPNVRGLDPVKEEPFLTDVVRYGRYRKTASDWAVNRFQIPFGSTDSWSKTVELIQTGQTFPTDNLEAFQSPEGFYYDTAGGVNFVRAISQLQQTAQGFSREGKTLSSLSESLFNAPAVRRWASPIYGWVMKSRKNLEDKEIKPIEDKVDALNEQLEKLDPEKRAALELTIDAESARAEQLRTDLFLDTEWPAVDYFSYRYLEMYNEMPPVCEACETQVRASIGETVLTRSMEGFLRSSFAELDFNEDGHINEADAMLVDAGGRGIYGVWDSPDDSQDR